MNKTHNLFMPYWGKNYPFWVTRSFFQKFGSIIFFQTSYTKEILRADLWKSFLHPELLWYALDIEDVITIYNLKKKEIVKEEEKKKINTIFNDRDYNYCTFYSSKVWPSYI